MNDLIIIGGGPAGIAAAVYAARKRLSTTLLTYAVDSQENFGGQSVVSEDVQNWIGTVSISGQDLAKALEAHARAYADDVVAIHTNKKVLRIEKANQGFRVMTEDGEQFEATAVLVATGSTRRKLTVPGADIYEHKGITYCASCDGPLFTGKDVVVIGGGNAGFETAAQLLAYTQSVTLLDFAEQFKADPVTVEKVLKHPNMAGITNAELQTIEGEQFVTKITYKDRASGEVREIPTNGVFVEIGLVPATSFVAGLVELNQHKQIVIDPRTQRTNVDGIWAAGDCTDVLYHQNNIAAGDAVRALEDIYVFLKTK